MSESKYESKIYAVPTSAEKVYKVLGNLGNVERVRDLIPKDKVQELEISEDYVRIKVDGLGQKITVSIVDRIENDTIKYGIEGVPMDIHCWIQLKELAPTDTRMRVTLKADIPMMFKMMLDAKLKQGIDQAAEMLSRFPYDQWAD